MPKEILEALAKGKISEGHARPLLMLSDKPEEQKTLFNEMLIRKMTVREAESLGRKVAQDKVRKQSYIKDPNILEIENSLGEKLGTRVHVEKRDVGGVIKIDFFSYDDLENIAGLIQKANISEEQKNKLAQKLEKAMADSKAAEKTETKETLKEEINNEVKVDEKVNNDLAGLETTETGADEKLVDDRSAVEVKQDENSTDDDLYNIKNFTI
jgi:ParB-like chromosome segregation protein Spo0J